MSEPDYHLIGTHTRYSSWTSRVETVLEYFQIPHTKQRITLDQVPTISPSFLVPLLQSRSLGITINDSLSICEFLADQNPHLPLWPRDAKLRALARSAAAEMHSSFGTIRNTYATNFLGRYTGNIPISERALKEVERILTIWDAARKATTERLAELGKGGDDEGFLFGEFGIVDAFFWPVLWRFRTYNLPLDKASPEALKWVEKMWEDPALKKLAHDYYRQAELPESRIEKYEDIFRDRDDVQYGSFPEDWEFTLPAR